MTPTFEDKERGVQLYLGDCLEILPSLSGIDAVVTDPPYGIGAKIFRKNKARCAAVHRTDYSDDMGWDKKPADISMMVSWYRDEVPMIVWGGNYFPLPPSSGWLVWDKMNGANRFSDAELAWTNLNQAVRLFHFMWNGMLRDGEPIVRVHPTQKPVELMEWCFGFISGDVNIEPIPTILDPYMGSGTTGIACLRTGRKFIGIEIDPKYYAIAEDRIKRELAQGVLL